MDVYGKTDMPIPFCFLNYSSKALSAGVFRCGRLCSSFSFVILFHFSAGKRTPHLHTVSCNPDLLLMEGTTVNACISHLEEHSNDLT